MHTLGNMSISDMPGRISFCALYNFRMPKVASCSMATPVVLEWPHLKSVQVGEKVTQWCPVATDSDA
jgi:hypothetical protein